MKGAASLKEGSFKNKVKVLANGGSKIVREFSRENEKMVYFAIARKWKKVGPELF